MGALNFTNCAVATRAQRESSDVHSTSFDLAQEGEIGWVPNSYESRGLQGRQKGFLRRYLGKSNDPCRSQKGLCDHPMSRYFCCNLEFIFEVPKYESAWDIIH